MRTTLVLLTGEHRTEAFTMQAVEWVALKPSPHKTADCGWKGERFCPPPVVAGNIIP